MFSVTPIVKFRGKLPLFVSANHCFAIYLTSLAVSGVSMIKVSSSHQKLAQYNYVLRTTGDFRKLVLNEVIGKNTIDNLMPRLFAKLQLSKRYMNHCIRVTMVTVLKENGYSNNDIARVTGHKNPLSAER